MADRQRALPGQALALPLNGLDFVQGKQKPLAGPVWRRPSLSSIPLQHQSNVDSTFGVLFERLNDTDLSREHRAGKDLVMFRLDLDSISRSELNSFYNNSSYPARIQAHLERNGRLSLRQKERCRTQKEDIFLTASTRCI